MPLHLKYDSTEPNSVLNWLERWSGSLLWKPISQSKKVPGTKSQKKQGNPQTVDTETGRIKKSIRRNPPSNLENVSTKSTSEIDKPRRSLRKVSSHPADSVQEHPQNELEKVKRSLRKIQNPNTEGTVPSEVDSEKPIYGLGKLLSSSGQNAAEKTVSESSEKVKTETSFTMSKQPDAEAPEEPSVVNEAIDVLRDDQTAVESQPSENNEKDGSITTANGDLYAREDLIVNESKKSAWKSSSPVKHEHPENGLQSGRTLPSYMAATESAKAKLRSQGSPRFGQDSVEKQNLTRRHSLPASTNNKISSPSLRAQKPLQASGKSGIRSDKSLLSSRDGNGK